MYIALATFTDGDIRFLALQPDPAWVGIFRFLFLVLSFGGGVF